MREEHGGNRWTQRKMIPGGKPQVQSRRRARAAIFEEAVGRRCSWSKFRGTSQMTAKRSQRGGLVGSTGALHTDLGFYSNET